jgi:hypothetical protein
LGCISGKAIGEWRGGGRGKLNHRDRSCRSSGVAEFESREVCEEGFREDWRQADQLGRRESSHGGHGGFLELGVRWVPVFGGLSRYARHANGAGRNLLTQLFLAARPTVRFFLETGRTVHGVWRPFLCTAFSTVRGWRTMPKRLRTRWTRTTALRPGSEPTSSWR